MKRTLTAGGLIVLSMAAWAAAELALTLRDTRRLAAASFELMDRRTAEALTRMDARLASIERRADAQLTATRRDTRAELRAGLVRADARLASIEQRADAQLSRLNDTLDTLSGDAQKTLQRTGAAVARVDELAGYVAPWFDCGELTGHTGQGKDCYQRRAWFMMLKADAALTEVAKAAPEVAEATRAGADHGRQAAEAAAQTAANVATLTRPAPKWARIVGLAAGIAVPAAGVAVPFLIGTR